MKRSIYPKIISRDDRRYYRHNFGSIHLSMTVDGAISLAIIFQIAVLAIKNIFASTLPQINQINTLLNIIIYTISIALYLFALNLTDFKIKRGSSLVLLFSISFLLSTFMLNYSLINSRYVIPGLMTFIAECVPVILLFPLLRSSEGFLKRLYRSSYYMASGVLIILVLIVVFKWEMISGYSMSYGFNAMFPAMILFSKSFRERNKLDFILASFCTIAVVMLGSRTPLLCIGSFFLFILLRRFGSNRHCILLIGLILAFVIFVSLNYVEIGEILSECMERIGFSSRTLTKMLSGSITSSSGRDVIHQRLIDKLAQSPIIGYGAFGAVKILDGILAHNLFLDIWATFGYIVGTVIIGYLVYFTIRNIWLYRETAYGELVAIFAFMVWPKAFVGGSVWTTTQLWMLIALFIWGSSAKNVESRYTSYDDKQSLIVTLVEKRSWGLRDIPQ